MIVVRVDGATASHDLVEHLLSLNTKRKKILFTTAWMITAADEDANAKIPADAWKPGTGQDGTAEDDKDVAEITRTAGQGGELAGRPCGSSSGG
jgi:hypothetical protein